MKPSARVALIVALAATTAPTWASLQFYSPDYTFDSMTGTGFKYGYPVFSNLTGDGVSPDGKATNTLEYFESNVESHQLIAVWRGQNALPTPQLDGIHVGARVFDINRSGWTCGNTELPNGFTTYSAIWQPDGTRIDLPHISSSFPNELFDGRAYDMSDERITVGFASKFENNETQARPVYWTSSREVVELANPLAIPNQIWGGGASRISSTGVIAGNMNMGSTVHAMKWDLNGAALVLPKTADTGITPAWTFVHAMLDDGTIVGRGRLEDSYFGMLWTANGEAIELRNLPDSTAQEVDVLEINNDHYSVGKARNSSGQNVAVRWSPAAEPMALDRLTDAPNNASDRAYDINDLNFAVGESRSSNVYQRAVLWSPDGNAFDMNSLVESGEWDFTAAGTITNTGWVAGVGKFDPAGPSGAYTRPFSILVPFAGTYGLGDANFDESIDFADLLIVAQNYGTQTNGSFDVGDFNLDGSVNFTDLLAIAQNYGTVLGQSVSSLNEITNLDFHADWQRAQSMVPEPGVMGLMIGALVMLRRR